MVAILSLLALLLLASSAHAQTGSGDERFLTQATITVERCAEAKRPPADCRFVTVTLSRSESVELRRILLEALRRNRSDETEARRRGQVTGGVWGFVSYSYRISFKTKRRKEHAWLHMGGGHAWLSGQERVGKIVFTDQEAAQVVEMITAP